MQISIIIKRKASAFGSAIMARTVTALTRHYGKWRRHCEASANFDFFSVCLIVNCLLFFAAAVVRSESELDTSDLRRCRLIRFDSCSWGRVPVVVIFIGKLQSCRGATLVSRTRGLSLFNIFFLWQHSHVTQSGLVAVLHLTLVC